MRLRDADDTHSVYVLYSDLLFNLVIVFLLVVLALVLRLNHRINVVSQRASTAAPPPAATTDATPDSKIARLTYERDESRKAANTFYSQLYAVRQQLADAQAAAQHQASAQVADAQRQTSERLAEIGQKLSIAAGANRFTGRTGDSSLCIGIDFSGTRPQYVLINSSDFSSAHATLDGESDAVHALRSARVLKNACRGAARFDLEDLRPLFAALQTRRPDDASSEEGQLTFRFSTRASAAASGWLDTDGDIDSASALRDLNRQPEFVNIGQMHSELIDRLLSMRDQQRPAAAPESVPVLHFSSGPNVGPVLLNNVPFELERFREIVRSFGDGGVVLQYDGPGNGICPDWIIRQVLTPVGYTNSVPDTAELKRLRQALAQPSNSPR